MQPGADFEALRARLAAARAHAEAQVGTSGARLLVDDAARGASDALELVEELTRLGALDATVARKLVGIADDIIVALDRCATDDDATLDALADAFGALIGAASVLELRVDDEESPDAG